MSREIIDTSKQHPLLHLAEAFFAGPSEAIEESERRGGQEMLQAQRTLPTDGSDDPAVQALGITWGPVDADDPLFREAILPDGWTRRDGEHIYGYWTYIDDENGRERARVFYKAAFYDRKAAIYATRYCTACDHVEHYFACDECGHPGSENDER